MQSKNQWNKVIENDEYLKIMQQIQTRDLSANDYDLLLKLDDPRTKSNNKDISK